MAPLKSSLSRNIGKLTKIFNTDSLGNTVASSVFSITGGDVLIPGDGYTYHLFLHSDPANANTPEPHSFVVSGVGVLTGINADILIVGGGGGGGSGYYGGGGGGGGVVIGAGVPLSDGTYDVYVGNGGVEGLYPPGPSSGADGGESAFDAVQVLGGGYGGSGPGGAGVDGSTTGANAGGSGGGYSPGGTYTPISIPGPWSSKGVWSVNQFARTSAVSNIYGGDGAGAAAPGGTGGHGAPISTFPGYKLGSEITPLIPLMGPTGDYYGGGGAGYNHPGGFDGGYGGGGPGNPGDVTPAPAHLGGGGGGSGNPRGHGGRGGSGMVVVRYIGS